ncbi:hypothetical protein T459_33655 [Capsicum annuum]|uniref:Uncharacterized protein n=1 Tax=Capsicum annuum TaxID=4072 RepID=A0A2G2XYB7_CAPAN|nr:hypothetical protein T459_33655 [Capsicum annuum]
MVLHLSRSYLFLSLPGVQIHNRHIEIIVHLITSKVLVSKDGLSNVFSPGDLLICCEQNEWVALWKRRSVTESSYWDNKSISQFSKFHI